MVRRLTPVTLLVLGVALIVCGCGGTYDKGGTTAGPQSPADSYKAQMRAWTSSDLNTLDSSALASVQDPANVTAPEMAAIQRFSDQTHTALKDLRAIKPSPELASDHEGFVSAFSALVEATDRLVSAVRDKSSSGFAAIETALTAAYAQIVAAQDKLAPEIGLPTPAPDTTTVGG